MARGGRELSDYLNMLEASSNGEDRVSDIGWISVRLIALGLHSFITRRVIPEISDEVGSKGRRLRYNIGIKG